MTSDLFSTAPEPRSDKIHLNSYRWFCLVEKLTRFIKSFFRNNQPLDWRSDQASGGPRWQLCSWWWVEHFISILFSKSRLWCSFNWKYSGFAKWYISFENHGLCASFWFNFQGSTPSKFSSFSIVLKSVKRVSTVFLNFQNQTFGFFKSK